MTPEGQWRYGRMMEIRRRAEMREVVKNVRQCMMVVAGLFLVGPTPAFAMPTAKEMEKVRPIVKSLMQGDVERMKRGTGKARDVGEAAVSLSKEADTQAAQYLLLTGAISYFAKDGAYDRIEDALMALKEAIPDLPAREIARLASSAVSTAPKSDESANRLRAMVEDCRAKEKAEAQVKKMRQAIAKNPADKSMHTRLAESLAVVGDWSVALAEFARGDNKEAARVAKAELAAEGGAGGGDAADFWWEYANGRSKSVKSAVRQHAVELYKSGIAEGKITGLAKVQAERRIAESCAEKEADKPGTAVAATTSSPSRGGLPAKEISLGAGTTLVFRPCARGSFTMGWPEEELLGAPAVAGVFHQCEVKLKKDFWMAEVLLTERVWGAVMGEKSDSDNPKAVTMEQAVKFIEKFRGKAASRLPSGCVVRLPTYAEYEYALKAGGAEQGTAFSQLNPSGDEADAIRQRADESVMSPRPNQWGLRGLRMKGCTVWIADRLGFDKKELSPTAYRWDATGMRIGRIDWPKTSSDPVVPLAGGANFPIYLWDKGYLHPYGVNDGDAKAFLRLVMAPKLKE